jgi:hypothetical protein
MKKAKQNPFGTFRNLAGAILPLVGGGAAGYVAGTQFKLPTSARIATGVIGSIGAYYLYQAIQTKRQKEFCAAHPWNLDCIYKNILGNAPAAASLTASSAMTSTASQLSTEHESLSDKPADFEYLKK